MQADTAERDPKWNNYIGLKRSDEIAQAVIERIKRWSYGASRNGLIQQWRQNYRLYYNASPFGINPAFWDSFALTGDNAELLQIRVNQFRNILTHIINAMYGRPPTTKALAANSNPEALDAASLCDAVIQQAYKGKRLGRHMKKAGELSLIFGTGFQLCEWDVLSGEPFAPDDAGDIVRTGDVRMRSKSVLDVYWDQSKEDMDDLEWVIVRDFANRYVLADQFPESADKILALPSKDKWDRALYLFSDYESDDIPVYKFFHKPMGGRFLKDGRLTICLDEDVVLYDGDNPYGQIPLFAVRPAEGLGTVYGYTPANDLAPLQVLYNLVISTIATNVAAHGVGNVSAARGSDVSVSQLVGGMNLIEHAPGFEPPAPLNLLATPAEVYSFEQRIEKLMETLPGVNSVARGQPDENLKSGRALAIVQGAMVQFVSGFYQSVANNYEDVSNFLLKLYQKFGTVPQIVSVVGKDKAIQAREWTGNDLRYVHSITVELVDPITSTWAGKLDKADALLNAKMIATPQEYITLTETGQIEPLLKADLASIARIRKENEMILQGKEPIVLDTDSHQLDITEHSSVVADPEIRSNPMVMKAYAEHVAKHKGFLMGLAPQMGQSELGKVGQLHALPGGQGLPGAPQGSILPQTQQQAAPGS